MQSGALMLMWLLLVLALIPASLWLLKRSGFRGMGGTSGAPATRLKLVSQLGLGPGQRVVMVEVGEGGSLTTLVLGVSPQGIQPLMQLPATPAVASPEASPFAQLLKKAEVPS